MNCVGKNGSFLRFFAGLGGYRCAYPLHLIGRIGLGSIAHELVVDQVAVRADDTVEVIKSGRLSEQITRR